MFSVSLKQCGKSFNRKWLFRQLDFEFKTGNSYAILGPNGSGKSTLSLIIAGQTLPTEGEISWIKNGRNISLNQIYMEVSLASPALELPEELNTRELFSFHTKSRPFFQHAGIDWLCEKTGWGEDILSKPVAVFSSGMKQRLKLALAFFTDSSLLILDEPLTNLDENGKTFYKQLLSAFSTDRLIIVASNRQDEYDFCNEQVLIG